MKIAMRTVWALSTGLILAACHQQTPSQATATSPPSYGASLTQVEIRRVADRQAMPVTGLPAEGTELVVR